MIYYYLFYISLTHLLNFLIPLGIQTERKGPTRTRKKKPRGVVNASDPYSALK